MNPVIDIQSLNFSYGSVPTLSDIDLQVAEGEFLGIVGPNAGGKSTLLLLVLVVVTVVLLIQVVGLILVLALLTLPAAVAGHYVHSLGRMMLIATVLGALLSVAGLALSYGPDLPAGPTIILLACGVYVVSAVSSQVLSRRRAQLAAARGAWQGETRE